MANTKYKKKYAQELIDYFMRFIELRDDPKDDDRTDRKGMIPVVIDESGAVTVSRKPCAGYPTLTKFAIKKGVTPRTITNWRDKYPEFEEACEFVDAIQDDILNERALTGAVDGRVAMKIRELKAASKKDGDSFGGGVKLTINIGDDDSEEKITVQKWTGPVNEDTDY